MYVDRWQEIVKIRVSGGNLDHHTDIDVLREKGGSELTIVLQHSTPGKVKTLTIVLQRGTSDKVTKKNMSYS